VVNFLGNEVSTGNVVTGSERSELSPTKLQYGYVFTRYARKPVTTVPGSDFIIMAIVFIKIPKKQTSPNPFFPKIIPIGNNNLAGISVLRGSPIPPLFASRFYLFLGDRV
jgi:hypothetical protein